MVHRELWERAVPEDAMARSMTVFLCVGCLERRLGRELTAADFKHVSLNRDSVCDSHRLSKRKRHGRENV